MKSQSRRFGMKETLALISLSLFTAVSVTAQSQSGQDKSTSKAQIVGTAEVVKIDAKKKTLQVRNVAEGNPTTPRPERRGGGSGGGRRRGGYPGGGYPGGRYPGGGYPGGGRYPDGDGGPSGGGTSQVKEYKVFVTKDTVLKLDYMDTQFSDLHVGDRIVVSGY